MLVLKFVNVTYVLPHMEKVVQLVTFPLSIINQSVLSITRIE